MHVKPYLKHQVGHCKSRAYTLPVTAVEQSLSLAYYWVQLLTDYIKVQLDSDVRVERDVGIVLVLLFEIRYFFVHFVVDEVHQVSDTEVTELSLTVGAVDATLSES